MSKPTAATRFVAASVAFWTLVVAIRVGAVVALWPGLATDPDAYIALTESWRRSGTYGLVDENGKARPTAFRPPAYPTLLAATTPSGEVEPLQVAALHVLLGLGTVLGTLVWGRAVGSTKVAYLAAAAVAVDPILLYQSARPMTETLATFLAVWALAGLAWGSKRGKPMGYLLSGVALGVACLTRPTFLPVFALWSGYLAIRAIAGRQAPGETGTFVAREGAQRSFLLFAIPVFALLAGWTVRNAMTLGAPVVATTHGGYTLILGNNDDFYRWLEVRPVGTPVWKAQRLQEALDRQRRAYEESEIEEDRRLQSQARIWIAEHPYAFVQCSLYRFGRFWAPMPASEGVGDGSRQPIDRFAIGSWYVAAYAFAILGLFASRRRLASPGLAPALLMVLAFVAVHAVYWTDVRMRAPIMPAVYLFAAIGLTAFISRWRRRERDSSAESRETKAK